MIHILGEWSTLYIQIQTHLSLCARYRCQTHPSTLRTPIYSPTHSPQRERERNKTTNRERERERERATQKERQINKETDKQTRRNEYKQIRYHACTSK